MSLMAVSPTGTGNCCPSGPFQSLGFVLLQYAWHAILCGSSSSFQSAFWHCLLQYFLSPKNKKILACEKQWNNVIGTRVCSTYEEQKWLFYAKLTTATPHFLHRLVGLGARQSSLKQPVSLYASMRNVSNFFENSLLNGIVVCCPRGLLLFPHSSRIPYCSRKEENRDRWGRNQRKKKEEGSKGGGEKTEK